MGRRALRSLGARTDAFCSRRPSPQPPAGNPDLRLPGVFATIRGNPRPVIEHALSRAPDVIGHVSEAAGYRVCAAQGRHAEGKSGACWAAADLWISRGWSTYRWIGPTIAGNWDISPDAIFRQSRCTMHAPGNRAGAERLIRRTPRLGDLQALRAAGWRPFHRRLQRRRPGAVLDLTLGRFRHPSRHRRLFARSYP